MTMIQSYCGDYNDPPYYGTATHPTCECLDGKSCEPCDKLGEIEAQIENLHSRLRDLHEQHRQARVRRNHVHSPLIHRFPSEIVGHIFMLAWPLPDVPPCCLPFYRRPKHRNFPLILSKVCHTWRILALSTPRLWCDFSVDVQVPKFPLLNHQAAHSGLIPLSISISISSSSIHVATEALHWVVRQLHRTSSLYVELPHTFLAMFDSVCDSFRLKAAPLLWELHIHCNMPHRQRLSRLKLTIEPPRPRHVVLESVHFDHVFFDCTNISNLSLKFSRVDGLFPGLLTSTNLKQLAWWKRDWDLLIGQTLVNRSIEDLTLGTSDSVEVMLPVASLPLLRKLEIHVEDIRPLRTVLGDFLRRSLCPLQVLIIHDWVYGGEGAIHVLLEVLENTRILKQLTVRLYEDSPSWSFEPLVQRLTSDRDFLPSLQSFCLEIRFVPPIGSLLNILAVDEQSSEITNDPNPIRPLCELNLNLWLLIDELGAISHQDLQQILQLRAAGKTISIRCYSSSTWDFSEGTDLVEYWKATHMNVDQ